MEKKSVEITEKYDAIIIGFGKGGKTLAKALGDAGKKTVLIERSNKMYGGTCPNVGCVPTKSLVYRAGLIPAGDGSFEDKARAYKEAVEHKNSLTGKLRERNYQKLTNHPNITVMDGTARFVSSHDVEVERDGNTVKLTGKQIFIDTGSSAFVPPIDGVKGNPYVYTSETLLEQKELPKNLVIIGGGYIGVEFSSIYASFGSKVSILQDGDVFLPREDADIAGAVRKSLSGRGIDVLTGVKVKAVEQAEGRAAVVFEDREGVRKLEADAVLIATGRRPNTKELNLEAAGIGIIQIDEPALREGLPLKRSDWDAYLQWGVEAFRLNAAVAKDDTQIHTHMCYCEFNDIMDSIAALDADVITIETSRSDMELLESFEVFEYPNEIGPGVYDIHSPNVPSVEWIEALLEKAAQRIPAERLWVNPDCGLKTRGWPETRAALANMVQAARNLRQSA